MHPALRTGNRALVTGGASGIGLAIARRLRDLGLAVTVADLPGPALGQAGAEGLQTEAIDIADAPALADLAARLGAVDVLFANAGIQPGSSVFDDQGTWGRIVDVNLMGAIRSVQALGPAMIARDRPGLIVLTGSKQGITTPPGDPAYNVAKAGLRAFAEALQHDLRNRPDCRTEARLFIPGFVWTPLSAMGRSEQPPGAWSPEQVVDFLFAALETPDFYILCPDNDVDRATDQARILWAAQDIIENRPPLSRWHPDWAGRFAAFLAGQPGR